MTNIVLPALIQQMMQASFYPHPVIEPIQLIQTHVSYVLLTGEYVYKVKKPVNFGFLNYSTLELRQRFCNDEMRLNQRGAAELYLEVLPITETASGFQLGGTGEPVEYVLKMVQFPQENLLSNIFEQGQLGEKELEELGRVVAQFHEKAEKSDRIRSFGEIPQVRAAFDENYAQTEKYIGGPQTELQFAETQAFTDAFFANKQELLQSRIKNNWIRECHGDLHLRNMCLWQNQIRLFDCIEFNEPFRFVDVIYDAAFVVMDLEARGRKDLGNIFLNTYIEQTGDWEGLQVLPLYLSRQAYVRAKVTSFLLDDPGVPADEKAAASKTAADYYKLAWEYTRSRQGQLFLMSGLSGSGKSTVARQLAKRLGAIHIRSDAARKHIGGVPLDQQGGSELYSADMTQKTYNRLLSLGILLANQGFSVILDAKYDQQALRQAVIDAATSQHLPLQILYCTAPEQVLRDRLSSRTGDISDATVDLLAAQQTAFTSFTEAEQPFVTTLDTTKDWEQQLKS